MIKNYLSFMALLITLVALSCNTKPHHTEVVSSDNNSITVDITLDTSKIIAKAGTFTADTCTLSFSVNDTTNTVSISSSAYSNDTIRIDTNVSSITFTLLKKNNITDISGLKLIAFKDESSGITFAPNDSLTTASNSLQETITPPTNLPQTEIFHLHCYYTHNADSVYHLIIDPKLKVSQPPAPNE